LKYQDIHIPGPVGSRSEPWLDSFWMREENSSAWSGIDQSQNLKKEAKNKMN